jgi:hypothetical protein
MQDSRALLELIMVVRQSIDVETLGRHLAVLLRSDATVRELWVSARSGIAEFWIATAPIDMQVQRELYGTVSRLHDQFPDALFDVHVLNPYNFENGTIVRNVIPASARRILPRSA